MSIIDIKKLPKEGKLFYHHLHGVVKYIAFDYGFTMVEKWGLVNNNYGVERIRVVTSLLQKYNKKKHGEFSF